MDSIKTVDIDPAGVFKYILIKAMITDASSNTHSKEVVRGYADCPYHIDINDRFSMDLSKLKASGAFKDWKTKVLGGGRIKHDPDAKSIFVYGYSQGYGKAEHEVSVGILKTAYPDYTITWSDEGY